MSNPQMQRLRKIISVAMGLGLSVFSLTFLPTASAHTTLVSSSPSNGQEVTTWPTQVVLNFAEDLQTLSSQEINFVTVTNAQGREVSGSTSVSKNVTTTTLQPNDAQGIVLVNYRVAAQDGHVVEGEFTFTYGKSSEVTPSSSPIATVVAHQEAKSHTGIYATTTVLIVFTLLFGLWIYKRD
ncbi:MAG: copper resistance CopC family protein [Actinomycetes bacterium]